MVILRTRHTYDSFVCGDPTNLCLFLSLSIDSTMRMDPLLQGLRRLSLGNSGGKKRCQVVSRFQKQTSFRHIPKKHNSTKAALNNKAVCSTLHCDDYVIESFLGKCFICFWSSFFIVVHFWLEWYVEQTELNALMSHWRALKARRFVKHRKRK